MLPSGGVTKNFENMMMYIHEKEKSLRFRAEVIFTEAESQVYEPLVV